METYEKPPNRLAIASDRTHRNYNFLVPFFAQTRQRLLLVGHAIAGYTDIIDIGLSSDYNCS
ncbi:MULTISPECIES: hypothetical protein [Kamptonema]|uniref:hypothetical protein n=1 Tax=Kamptonema TaxID=1501433 RepID=UPI0002F71046|nr:MULTISPECIES: hypothetical protein [Kamptonema]